MKLLLYFMEAVMKTLHLICNAHLDPVWQWELEESAAAAVLTFRAAADFCEEFDSFVFNHNEVIYINVLRSTSTS